LCVCQCVCVSMIRMCVSTNDAFITKCSVSFYLTHMNSIPMILSLPSVKSLFTYAGTFRYVRFFSHFTCIRFLSHIHVSFHEYTSLFHMYRSLFAYVGTIRYVPVCSHFHMCTFPLTCTRVFSRVYVSVPYV